MNLSAIDLNLFLVLHTVLDERSATRAAKRLNVTQSAVSNALARLRAALGDPLVVRRGRGLVATPRAAELAPIVAQAVAELQAALDRSAGFAPGECTRRFTIAAADNHQASEASRIAAAVARRLPRASLRFVSADFLAATDGLASGEIDVAFAPSSIVAGPYRGEHVFDEHACFVVRRDHPKVRRTISPELFAELGHIDVEVPLGKTGVGHREIERHWRALGFERRVAMTVPYFTTAVMMAARTDLVAGLPSRAAVVLGKAFGTKIARAGFALPSIAVSLMWHQRTDADPAAAYFRRLVVATARR